MCACVTIYVNICIYMHVVQIIWRKIGIAYQVLFHALNACIYSLYI